MLISAGKSLSASLGFLPVDIANLQVGGFDEKLGWSGQALIDLSVCVLGAQALEAEENLNLSFRTCFEEEKVKL